MAVLINTSILDTTCSMTLLPWTVHCLEDEQLAAVWWRHILKGRRGQPYNFATNMLKVYLSTQTSSLSAFVIWKTHTVAKKSRGRQLNPKVCGVTVICVPPVNVCPQTHFPSDIHSPKQISLAYFATLALFPRVNCSPMIKGKKIALFQDRTYMMQGGTV